MKRRSTLFVLTASFSVILLGVAHATHTPAPGLTANSYADCQSNYSGTVYDPATKACICPKGDPHGRDPIRGGCPLVNEDCQKKFGFYSRANGFNSCACTTGYTLQPRGGVLECVKDNPFAPPADEQKKGLWSLLLNTNGVLNFLGGIIFGILASRLYRLMSREE